VQSLYISNRCIPQTTSYIGNTSGAFLTRTPTFWYEEFFENDRLYLFNETGINDIKDALESTLQQ